nr:MAG TPA_asm: HNH endonuclease [Caudoviricetes sp.]
MTTTWGGRKTQRLFAVLLERDRLPGPRPAWRCWSCEHVCTDPQLLSVEHIKPRSQGGSDDLANLALSHRSCNSSRGDKPIDQWREGIVDRSEWVKALATSPATHTNPNVHTVRPAKAPQPPVL